LTPEGKALTYSGSGVLVSSTPTVSETGEEKSPEKVKVISSNTALPAYVRAAPEAT